MNTFLGIPVDDWLSTMREDSRKLTTEIYKTPKWRKIKRYRLFEKREKLDDDRGLLSHVLNDDEGY